MIVRRRPALAVFSVALVSALGVGVSPAHALRDVTATVDIASTPDGPQLVIRINGGNAVLVREKGTDELEINETGSFGMAVAPGAASRCRLDPESDTTRVFCSRNGLLTATATRKPLRFEMGPDGGRANANDSPFAIEAQGGAGNDQMNATKFDDLIRLGAGDDSADGWPGNDLIELGPGDDWAQGWDGEDRIDGGDGHDIIGGGGGRDQLIGGAGDDLLFAEPNAEYASGSPDIVRDADGHETESIDQPTDCGPGDDTVSQWSARLDPVLPNCEHTLVQSSGEGALAIQGTLQVGTTLTAARPPVGVEPSFRAYRWLACDDISYGAFASGCVARSSCSTFTLEARDAGKQIMVLARTVYTLSGGRYKLQPSDEHVWTWLGVGEQSTPLGRNDQDRWASGGYPYLYLDVPGYQDRTGDDFTGAVDGPVCAPLTGPVNGTRTDGTTQTETGGATPAGTTPTPTGAAPSKVGSGVPPAGGAAGPSGAAASAKALAGQLAKALGATTSRVLLRKRSFSVKVAVADGTVIRVQVKRDKRWVNVGVGRIAAGKVIVKLGATGRARLRAATRGRTKTKLRVLVRPRGERDTIVSASLRR